MMRKIEDILKEMKPLMGSADAEERKRLEDLMKELESRPLSDEEKVLAAGWWSEGMDEVHRDIDAIRRQIDDDSYKLIPMSYIARHYFGKSASWLYQRINGYKVRGKVYKLNREEADLFNRALKEVGERISSLSITV